MQKAKINAREVVTDIRAGLDDAALMERYKLTAAQLQILLTKLVEAGAIKQSELDHRAPMFEGTVEVVFKFPAFEDEEDRKELANQLIQACKKGLITDVNRLLDRGADINARGQWGMTPLMWAASKGHWRVVKLLLDRGADVNLEANNQSTALMWTAFAGHRHLVKLLLERGADVNAASNCGRTALISAAFNGHIEVVKLLLEEGADPARKDQTGMEALAYAAGRGHKNVRDLILHYLSG